MNETQGNYQSKIALNLRVERNLFVISIVHPKDLLRGYSNPLGSAFPKVLSLLFQAVDHIIDFIESYEIHLVKTTDERIITAISLQVELN